MNKSFAHVLFAGILLFSVRGPVFAQDGTAAGKSPAAGKSAVEYIAGGDVEFDEGLSLEECVEVGLRNNLGLRSASFRPRIAAAAIIEAKADFDVSYSLAYAFADNDFPSATVLDGAAVLRQKSHQVNTKLTKKLLTGGSIEFGFYTNHQNSNSIFASVNPRSDSSFSLSIMQRLLRGFGLEYNRSQIDTRRNEERIEDLRFEKDAMDLAFRVERAYWDYAGYVHDLRVRDESIKTAEQTVADVTKRFEGGKALELDKLEAEEDLENQKLSRLITAKKAEDAREALIRLIEPFSKNVRWDMKICVPRVLALRKTDTDLNENVSTALKNRQELLQAEVILENLRIEERVARNEMLPTFNLGYELTWHGLDYQTLESVRDISIDRYVDDQLSAYFEYPLFNRAAKSRFTRARYELDRALIDVDSLRMDVTLDVRSAVRNVEVARNATEVATRSLDLAVKKLAAEELRLDRGFTTLRDVLEFRQEKVRAETLYIRAKIDYEQAANFLERATARTFEKYDISVPRDQIAGKAFDAAREYFNGSTEHDSIDGNE